MFKSRLSWIGSVWVSLLLLTAGITAAGVNVWTPLGPYSSVRFYPSDLVLHPTNPAVLYAASGDRVLESLDGGVTWKAIDNGALSFLRELEIDPATPTTLYGAGDSGFYKSTDGGVTWSAVNDGLEGPTVDTLTLDPAEPTTLYATRPEGVFKSTDGGGHWARVDNGEAPARMRVLVIDPSTPTTLYGGGGNPAGLFKSSDGGVHWSPADNGLAALDVSFLVIDPQNPQLLYAGSSAGVFKSSDGGSSWAAGNAGLTAVDICSLTLVPTAPATLYAGTCEAGIGGVFKSTDGAESWTDLSVGLEPLRVQEVAVHPQDPERLFVAQEGFALSADGGESWTRVDAAMRPVPLINVLEVDPQAPSRLYVGSGAGSALLELQPPGLFTSSDGGLSWSELLKVPMVALLIDAGTPPTLYASTLTAGNRGINGSLRKSTDGGVFWPRIDQGLADESLLTQPIVTDLVLQPSSPTTLYAGTPDGVFKTTNGGLVWGLLEQSPSGVAALVTDPLMPSRLFAGTSAGVFATSDGGDTWMEHSSGLEGSPVPVLAIDPESPSTLYAGTPQGIFKTVDGGSRWSEVDDPRYASQVTALVIDPLTPTNVYAAIRFDGQGGGPAGVLIRTTDGGGTWAPLEPAFDLPVRAMAIDPLHPSTLYAATDGRGVFALTQVDPAQQCVAGPTTLCIDDEPGDQRFRVTLKFETTLGGGQAGEAVATPLAGLGIGRGGVMAFLDPTNPELLIKVLNGCSLNKRYWVFAAAATTVGFHLAVEDTVAGAVKVYNNPDRHPAETVTDTAAFDTCHL